MRKFIISTLAYIFLLALPVVMWFALNHEEHYDLPMDRNVLYLGDSHVRYSVNNEIVSNAVVLARSGEPLLGAYINLRTVLNSKNSIDTVVLSLWEGTLNKPYKGVGDYSVGAFDRRMEFVTMDDFLKANETPVFLIRPTILSMLYNSSTPLGDYNHTEARKLQLAIKREEDLLEESPLPLKLVYTEGVQYESLVRIRELCESNNIKLILLSTPIYRAEKYYHQSRFVQQLRDELDGYTYIDHTDFELPESGFRDLGHLNSEGAEIYSKAIEEHGLFGFGRVIEL